MRATKKVSESLTEQQYLIRPSHINHYGRLFGGQLLYWIDELAGIVAIRHSGATVTTKGITAGADGALAVAEVLAG